MNQKKEKTVRVGEFLLKGRTLDDLLCVESSDEEDISLITMKNKKLSADPEFMGKILLKRKLWAEAVQMLTVAISSNPTKSSLYSNRAVALLKMRQFKSAEEDCTKAVDMKKNSFKAYLRRALARKCQGKFLDACLDCWKIFDLHPGLKTEVSMVRKEYDEMIKCAIEELVGIITGEIDTKYHPEMIEKLRNEFSAKEKYFGNQLLLNRKFERAIIKYTNAIRLMSKDPTFYANRALCWMELNKYKEAEEDCSKALKLDNTYVKVLVRRARVRKALGNLLGAKEDFMSASALKEEDDSIREELRALNTSLELDPLLLVNLKAREERKKKSDNRRDNGRFGNKK